MAEPRPDIASISDGSALKQWYRRKVKLTAHARTLGLKQSGAKFTVLDRIAHILDTGERDLPGTAQAKPKSRFDWHSADLTPQTILTDSYRNTQNVRRFFKEHLGESFKFSIAFMDWSTANTGLTLEDACDQWRILNEAERSPGHQTAIKPHNQFNQYTRDFLADNPDLGMDDVRRAWAKVIARPSASGRHAYDPSGAES